MKTPTLHPGMTMANTAKLAPRNRTLCRIKQLDQQISAVKAMIDKGEHTAAGLTIDLNVGPLDEDRDGDVRVEVSWDSDVILNYIHGSLIKSRTQVCRIANEEFEELQAFFANGLEVK